MDYSYLIVNALDKIDALTELTKAQTASLEERLAIQAEQLAAMAEELNLLTMAAQLFD